MSFLKFIANHWQQRLSSNRSIVIYDGSGALRGALALLDLKELHVVDTSESSMRSRLEAWDAWLAVGADESLQTRLLVYVPQNLPTEMMDVLADPYQPFRLAGCHFPDGAGDSLRSLAKKFVPSRAAEVDKLFENTECPDLSLIDALRTSKTATPHLQTIFGTDEFTTILRRFLLADDSLRKTLEASDDWAAEFRSLVKSSLGLDIYGKATTWKTLSEKLWNYLLFSEFAFDLPEGLPEELEEIPRAQGEHIDVINHLCQELRDYTPSQSSYIAEAERVSTSFGLEKICEDIHDLGQRDTFAFEERSFLKRFEQALSSGDRNISGEILTQRKGSLWANHESRQSLWRIAELANDLCTLGDELDSELPKLTSKGDALVNFFSNNFRRLDTLHREMEQAVADVFGDSNEVTGIIDLARTAFKERALKLQKTFLTTVETEGWPLTGMEANSGTFNRLVAPLLEQKTRVVYFMIDALRFELGICIEQELVEQHEVSTEAVCAQLPCVTRFGMAALLPGAETDLRLVTEKSEVQPKVGDQFARNPNERLKVFQSVYGERCSMIKLDELIGKKNLDEFSNTDLLVVRSTEIDESGEINVMQARTLIPRIVRMILTACNRLQDEAGFGKAVIATDHGFHWLDDLDQGDSCPVPPGDWKLKKRRCLLGSGDASPTSVHFSTAQVGIPTDLPTYAVPRNLGVFALGSSYFHEGFSPQESIVPAISVNLKSKDCSDAFSAGGFEVNLNYKQGNSKKIMTRRPSIEIGIHQEGLFAGDHVRFQLEAVHKKAVVGRPAPCQYVDPSTNYVQMPPQSFAKLTLIMDEEFNGEFELRAIDPDTKMPLGKQAKLKLYTDYIA
ncbi:MAG: PglZ domain-containing protein [Akkermansiaceae bacterium]|nr:PglZ domain-containing protein [Akkermansiaceae bacterium]